MKKILFTLLFLLSSISYAENRPWTEQEKLLGATALTLHAVDVSQTSYAMRQQGFHEMNPLLGSRPHEDKLAAFFVLSSLGAYYFLDHYEDNRKVTLYAIIGVKSILISRHIGMGLKVRF